MRFLRASSSVVIQRTSSLSSSSLLFLSPLQVRVHENSFSNGQSGLLWYSSRIWNPWEQRVHLKITEISQWERTGEEFKGGKKKTDGEWLKDQSEWDAHTKRERGRIRGLVEGRFKFPFLSIQPSSDVSVSRGGTFPFLVGRKIIFLHRFAFSQTRKSGEEFSRNETFVSFVSDERYIEGCASYSKRNGSRL